MSLAEELKLASGYDPFLCFQCGECSSSCQMTGYKGFSPLKLIHSIQLGWEGVLVSRAYELCLHCFLCSVRCPQGISFPDLATALSNLANFKYGLGKVERVFLNEIRENGFLNPARVALKTLGVGVLRRAGLRGLKLANLLFEKGKVRRDLLEEVRGVERKS